MNWLKDKGWLYITVFFLLAAIVIDLVKKP
jgi:hypothetical protein